MQVRLLLNLGAADAARAGLDLAAASAGSVIAIDDEIACEFLNRCWAVRIPARPPKPARLQAVPTVELKATEDPTVA